MEEDLESEERFRQVVTTANKKFHYIYKYLQFRMMPMEERKINKIEAISLESKEE